MTVARLFVAKAHFGHEDSARGEAKKLYRLLSDQPGFVEVLEFSPESSPGLLIGITVWETKEDAERAINRQEAISLISHILTIADETSTEGGLFDVELLRSA